ncbi:MAG: hypothetical protein Ct9H90mP26_1090 [Methanobacteriota archaeon]|nr:MAG: hypothetical protein Ct9H90mP26_1090 [Euryarchaeota archaeon]
MLHRAPSKLRENLESALEDPSRLKQQLNDLLMTIAHEPLPVSRLNGIRGNAHIWDLIAGSSLIGCDSMKTSSWVSSGLDIEAMLFSFSSCSRCGSALLAKF